MPAIGHKELTLQEVLQVILEDQQPLSVDEQQLANVATNHEFLRDFAKGRVLYGVNTGFGPMAQYLVPEADVAELQRNLIRSHSAGLGAPLSPQVCRAAMIVRMHTLMQARSGVHPSVLDLLAKMIESKCYPVIYEHGGVGASGDLVQLAHIGLGLMGEGLIYDHGEIRPAGSVFAEKNWQPIQMHLREGLALINGTAVMTAIGLINYHHAQRLIQLSIVASGLINEIVRSFDDHLDEKLHLAKCHEGQQRVAHLMRLCLQGSQRLRNRHRENYDHHQVDGKLTTKLQEYYSIRCVPQIVGPIHDTIQIAGQVLLNEFHSCSDNPIIVDEEERILHGGNFHGDYISLEMDKMRLAMTKLSMLAERQLNFLLNPKLNDLLPPFLNSGRLGLHFGMQGCQFTATSTVAENQTLSAPIYTHSISCNNDNQDIVSMGTNAALLSKRVIDNTYQVMAIELTAILRSIDLLGCAEEMSDINQRIHEKLSAISPVMNESVAWSDLLNQFSDRLSGSTFQDLGLDLFEIN